MQPPNALEAELTELAQLPLDALRQRWEHTFKNHPPQAARSEYLVRALAFQIQAAAGGGFSRTLARRLAKLEASKDEPTKSESVRKLQPGTRLLRDWKGTTHEVEVVAGGFRHLGTMYASLSEVARKITGTRWSGPRFFGLEVQSPAASKKGAAPTYIVDLSSKARPKVDGTPHGR